jgi:hypothetical protein
MPIRTNCILSRRACTLAPWACPCGTCSHQEVFSFWGCLLQATKTNMFRNWDLLMQCGSPEVWNAWNANGHQNAYVEVTRSLGTGPLHHTSARENCAR